MLKLFDKFFTFTNVHAQKRSEPLNRQHKNARSLFLSDPRGGWDVRKHSRSSSASPQISFPDFSLACITPFFLTQFFYNLFQIFHFLRS
jgi:hypothetical protein